MATYVSAGGFMDAVDSNAALAPRTGVGVEAVLPVANGAPAACPAAMPRIWVRP